MIAINTGTHTGANLAVSMTSKTTEATAKALLAVSIYQSSC